MWQIPTAVRRRTSPGALLPRAVFLLERNE